MSERAEQYEMAKAMLLGGLAVAAQPEEEIRKTISLFRSTLFRRLTDADEQGLFLAMTAALAVQMDLGVVVEAREHQPWLDSREFEWRSWSAYHQWLLRSGRPPVVLDALGRSLDVILDHMGNPAESAPWRRRGLVIGDVQSGKTSTYIGLMNKAIDAGYRVIILLTGNTESLRQQTQLRVNEGVIGRDAIAAQKSGTQFAHAPAKVGIGQLVDTSFIVPLTTRNADFKKQTAQAMNLAVNNDNALIFVTKKNKTVLDRIYSWLQTQDNHDGKLRVPLLLIDDESDYASVNTRDSDNDPTRINAAIRGLLGLFWRNSYVAFTATPFANIFIDDEIDDDLFPSDLVYGLDSPSNYVGPDALFGRATGDADETLRFIVDAEESIPLKHKRAFEVDELPPSLLEALRTFLIVNAIRDLRGQESEPRSMLVNVSRFIAVQDQVFLLIEAELIQYRNAIQWHGAAYAMGTGNEFIRLLEDTFQREFLHNEYLWSEVLQALPRATQNIVCKLMNSLADRGLESNELSAQVPDRYIAVGGNILSRGLTLGGLAVSYFYRAPEADDTLMQMGRWFGYREGYGDICRVWMTLESASHFAHAADSLEELRLELVRMRDQKLSPKQYGLAVRNHPGSHRLTAAVKMRHASVRTRSVSLRGRAIESYELPSRPREIERNRDAALSLLEALTAESGPAHPRGSGHLWSRVPRDYVATFFDEFSAADTASGPLFLDGALAKFIRRAESQDLRTWDVAVIAGSGTSYSLPGVDDRYRLVVRRVGHSHDSGWLVSDQRRRVAGTGDVALPLEQHQRDEVKAMYFRQLDAKKNVPDKKYIEKLQRPLLILYFIQGRHMVADGKSTTEVEVAANPMVATVVAVPGKADETSEPDTVTYTMNTVAQRLWDRELDIEDGDADE